MLSLPAPAKVNLFLHITGRRQDGYHDLETLFQLLDFGDQLDFEILPSQEIKLSSNIDGVDSDDNLVVKAARSLQAKTGCTLGANIALKKVLPLGGGIGGGSSDAATTLLALNHLWDLQLSEDTLAEIGLELGADVPVFTRGNTAFAKGVGENLSPVEIPERWFLVVTPQVLVSTGKIFSHPQLTRDSAPIKIPPLAVEAGQNDCQAVVEMLYPEVAETRNWMQQYAPALMTGTGASLFSIFDNESKAIEVAQQIPNAWNYFVARGVNRSPAHEILGSITGD